MEAENWQRVRELFDALADLQPDEWNAALDERGIDDPVLREEVLALLQADREDVIRTVVDAQAPAMLADLSEREAEIENQRLAGLTVGAFRLIRRVGSGGMGTVWLASASTANLIRRSRSS